MSGDGWTEVELPDIVKFDTDGDAMEGTFLRTETIPNGNDPFDVYVFQGSEGLWQTSASGGLAPLMRDIQPGTYCRITRTGTRDTGKPSPMVEFKVATKG